MKLAAKLIVALVLGISGVMTFNTYLRLQGEAALFKADTIRDLRAMARAVTTAVETLGVQEGASRAKQFVRAINLTREDMDIHWVWLDETHGSRLAALSTEQREQLLRGRPVAFVSEGEDGEQRRYSFWPLEIETPRPAALELSISLEAQRRFIEGSRRLGVENALRVCLVCGLIVVGVGYWFVGRPIALLRDKARRVGSGDLSGRLVVQQRDEIGELAEELNAMCERLDEAQRRASQEAEARIAMLDQLRHADRLKTVGQLASGVAHELGTPLNVVAGYAKMIRTGDLEACEVRSSADVIVEQADRMTAIIRQLLDFSRRRGPALRAADLHEIATRTVEMLTPLADKRGISLELRSDSDLVPVEADSGQIQQALANLLINAIQASPNGGTVAVQIAHRRALPPPEVGAPLAEYACVVVSDHGIGISPEHLPHLFEPFFTTKDVGEGTGLGLAVAYGIVREHGGWIDVQSQIGEGSRFTLFLRPAQPPASTGVLA